MPITLAIIPLSATDNENPIIYSGIIVKMVTTNQCWWLAFENNLPRSIQLIIWLYGITLSSARDVWSLFINFTIYGHFDPQVVSQSASIYEGCPQLSDPLYVFIIGPRSREIMYLVASVRPSVRLCVLSWLNCLAFHLDFWHGGRPWPRIGWDCRSRS